MFTFLLRDWACAWICGVTPEVSGTIVVTEVVDSAIPDPSVIAPGSKVKLRDC